MHFRKEPEENFGMDMTPMIDVVFLLLIFFMVSTVFVDFSRKMDISLPKSKTSKNDEAPKKLLVEMTLDKKVFLDGKPVTLPEIDLILANPDRSNVDNAVIKADKGLPYGEVVEVMGILQSANIMDISVAVK